MKILWIITIFCLVLVQLRHLDALSCSSSSTAINIKEKLKQDILCPQNYDKYVKPKEIPKISLKYNIKSFDYDDESQVLSVSSWMVLGWRDSRLGWKIENYDKIKNFHVSASHLWDPEIKLFNSHILYGIGDCELVDCIVYSVGRVACVVPCVHQGHCEEFGFSQWPYDQHKCNFTFGCWSKNGEELNFVEDKLKVVTKTTQNNKMWKLTNATVVYDKGAYDGYNETYPTIDFIFKLERQNQLYTLGIKAPSVILMLANIAAFYFKPKSVRRFIICILVIISHQIYLEYLYWMISHCGDSIPTILNFFVISKIISGLVLVQTILLRIYEMKYENQQSRIVKFLRESPLNVGNILVSPLSTNNECETKCDDWQIISKMIDRISVAVVVLSYSLLYLAYFPRLTPAPVADLEVITT